MALSQPGRVSQTRALISGFNPPTLTRGMGRGERAAPQSQNCVLIGKIARPNAYLRHIGPFVSVGEVRGVRENASCEGGLDMKATKLLSRSEVFTVNHTALALDGCGYD